LYILVELLQKHAAAASRKGVVGKMGSTIPTAPKPTQIKPAISHSPLAIFGRCFPFCFVLQAFPLSIMAVSFAVSSVLTLKNAVFSHLLSVFLGRGGWGSTFHEACSLLGVPEQVNLRLQQHSDGFSQFCHFC